MNLFKGTSERVHLKKLNIFSNKLTEIYHLNQQIVKVFHFFNFLRKFYPISLKATYSKVFKGIVLSYVFLLFLPLTSEIQKKFGHWTISKVVYDYILDHTTEGDTVIELGAGWSTRMFSDHLLVYSVEHNLQFIKENIETMSGGKYPVKCIYSPIINGWYDPKILQKQLPKQSTVVLVDGPPWYIGRAGLLKHLDLFQNAKYIIVDDVHRKADHDLMIKIATALNRKYTIIKDPIKEFGIHKESGIISLVD